MNMELTAAIFATLMDAPPPGAIEEFLRSGGLAAITLLLVCLSAVVIYVLSFFLSLPLRRRERARLFLDVLETGLQSGRGLEDTIISVAQTRERSVGVRFHLLAAWLEKGLRLPEALAKVPHFLPPQIVAILHVGVELGDLPRVLPVCRRLLDDSLSQVRKAHSYLILLALVSTPACLFVLPMLNVFVLPKFQEIMKDLYDGETLPRFFPWLLDWRWELVAVQLACMAFVWLGALYYIAGPRRLSWFERPPLLLRDRLACWLPWKRKRLQRDFSALLALLLDAGLPEDKAVTLAAAGTANALFRRSAEAVVADLRRGVKLTEALRHMDDTGEFRWRITHAAHARSGFFAALAGWHDALDAQAFQQEQAAAHVVTTSLVLVNGAVVGFASVVIFQLLTGFIEFASLW